MRTDLILKSIAQYISLEPEETRLFISLLETRSFRKKDVVLREGEVPRYNNFVTKGCLREYTIDENGKLHIDFLAPENYWVSCLGSYLVAP